MCCWKGVLASVLNLTIGQISWSLETTDPLEQEQEQEEQEEQEHKEEGA